MKQTVFTSYFYSPAHRDIPVKLSLYHNFTSLLFVYLNQKIVVTQVHTCGQPLAIFKRQTTLRHCFSVCYMLTALFV